jgi:uncharacterized protein YukE
MTTRIEIEYDRQYANAEIQAILSRCTATTSVMVQLGVPYQALPGLALAGYQTETTALAGDVTALNALVDQIRTLLISIDAKARPLDEKNKAALKTLSGLLTTDADRALLDQITGPTPQSGGTPPTPPPPP